VNLRPRSVTLLAALLAGVLTDLVIFVPSLHYAYRSASTRVMLETTATLVGLLTTFLLWGRVRQRKRLDDLLLFVALALLSISNLVFAVLPALRWTRPHPFSMWTTLATGAVGAAVLATASVLRDRQLVNSERAALRGLLAVATILVILGGVVGAVVDRLPVGLDPARSQGPTNWPEIGNGSIVVSQMGIAVLFAVAAFGFTRRAERDQDELLLWLGAGSAVAALARVNYFVFPSLYSDWFYTGDALRLCFYVLLFIGAVREIHIYQRAYADSRVLEERRRIARDLHDGLAQELSFITTSARDLAVGSPRAGALLQLASAAQRGLDESRRAIASLTQEADEPIGAALVQAVEEIAERHGARVEVEAAGATDIAPDQREQLLRIAREAVTNAARHAGADVIRVELQNGGTSLRLRVDDDGAGFDVGAVSPNGFGLVAMKERAAAMGAEFTIDSGHGRGTTVEVRL
jgi:signal transduction histidine kinase